MAVTAARPDGYLKPQPTWAGRQSRGLLSRGDMDEHDWDHVYSDADQRDLPPVDEHVQSVSADLTPGRALDLGCGVGQNSVWLAQNGWTVTGLDISENAIRRARVEAVAAGVQATFIVGDASAWQPIDQYDFVISTYALPPRENRTDALRNAVSAVAPGGTLLITEFHVDGAALHGFDPDDLVTRSEVLEAIGNDLHIVTASKITTDHAHGHDSTEWPIVLIQATRI